MEEEKKKTSSKIVVTFRSHEEEFKEKILQKKKEMKGVDWSAFFIKGWEKLTEADFKSIKEEYMTPKQKIDEAYEVYLKGNPPITRDEFICLTANL